MMLVSMLILVSLYYQAGYNRNVAVENKDTIGSGVVIQTGYVLTNAHVISVGLMVNGKPAKLLAMDLDNDLALLKADTRVVAPIQFATPILGEDVYYVGNPLGHVGTLSIGHVVHIDEEFVRTDTIAAPGMSGGGLYNRRGQLIGLNDGMEGTLPGGYHFALHIPIKKVRKFLADNSRKMETNDALR